MSAIVSSPAAEVAAADTAEDGAAPSWTRWFTAASVLVAFVALGLTIWQVGPRNLLDQILDIGIGFGAVILLEILVTACDSAALSGFLGGGGRRPGYFYVLRAQMMGRAINAVTPLGSLGEATKATSLMERTSTPRAIGAVLRYNLAFFGLRLATIAIGAPICALVLDIPSWLTWLLVGGAAVSAALLVAGIYLVKVGMLASAAGALRALRLISAERAARWRAKLDKIDEHLRPQRGGSRRARWTPVGWVVLSRILTLFSTWVVLAATGLLAGPGTMAAITTAGQLIAVAASVVPMGLGIAEAGNGALFAALGDPAALGVAIVLGSRITTLAYAAIGLTLMGTATVVGSRK